MYNIHLSLFLCSCVGKMIAIRLMVVVVQVSSEFLFLSQFRVARCTRRCMSYSGLRKLPAFCSLKNEYPLSIPMASIIFFFEGASGKRHCGMFFSLRHDMNDR